MLAARTYYELGASELVFRFPEPGFLQGVKTKAKVIVRVTNMSFQYPGTLRSQIRDLTIQCTLSSRIAVLGPNGAGKTTQVKLLTGELVRTDGDVYQHKNIRIAYIKQHAFAHINNHLDKTLPEYIQRRFQMGEDREMKDRANTEEDDQGTMISRIEVSQPCVLSIRSRRRWKNSYEHECSFERSDRIGFKGEKWTLMSTADNTWIPRTEPIATQTKLVAEVYR